MVVPSYSVRNSPRRCNSGITSVGEIVQVRPATVCGMMLKPSAAPPRYHSSSASATSVAGADHDAVAARGGDALVELADRQVLRAAPCRSPPSGGPAGYCSAAHPAAARRADSAVRSMPTDVRTAPQRRARGWISACSRVELLLRLVAARGRPRVSTPGMILMLVRRAAALRRAALRGRRRTRAPCSSCCCTVNSTSAVRAASSRPASDCPACTITGWPCGERGIISGPRT